jgi:hypothetical protein
MKTPLVCTFLRSGGSLDRLTSFYAITSKRHVEHPNLVLLKYNQIASPLADPLVRECRGIVLDEANGWNVVSRSFDKFFNHGEGPADPIDWSSARVQEKKDGSLCTLYEYAGRWHVATTGTPDARGDVNWSGLTFADYFWDTFRAYGLDAVPSDATGYCYFFELTGPMNRIVVVHKKPGLTLLGARRVDTWEEVHPSYLADIFDGVPVVHEFDLGDFDEIVASFGAMSPLSQEGYVVVDSAFRRVKVKHPGYVALHHAKDGLSRKAFVEIARTQETPEVIAAFPELKPQLDDARARLDALVADVEASYETLRAIKDQKSFAMEAVKTRCSSALFLLRAGKTPSVRDYFAGMQVDRLVELLGYKDSTTPEAGRK